MQASEYPDFTKNVVLLLDTVEDAQAKKTLLQVTRYISHALKKWVNVNHESLFLRVQLISSLGANAKIKLEIGRQEGFRKMIGMLVDGNTYYD